MTGIRPFDILHKNKIRAIVTAYPNSSAVEAFAHDRYLRAGGERCEGYMSQCSVFKFVKCHRDDIFRQDCCLLEKAHAPAALVWLLFNLARARRMLQFALPWGRAKWLNSTLQ